MKSYKVKNESGQQFEVDEDKLHDAEKDGYLPVVSNGKVEHRVASADLPKAEADGYKPLLSAPEVSEWESLGRGAIQGATFGFGDEITGGLEALFTDKTYDQARDESRANNAAAQEANPASYLTGDIGASVATSFVPGLGFLNAAKGAKLATVAGKAALQGGIAGAGYSDEKDAAGILKDTATGVALGAAVPVALKGAGKVVSKLDDITGTSDKAKVVADYLSDKFHKVTDSVSDIATAAPSGTARAVREIGWKERDRIRNLSPDDLENKILGAKDDLENIFAKSEDEVSKYRGNMEQAAMSDIYDKDRKMILDLSGLSGADASKRIAPDNDALALLRKKLETDADAMVGFQDEVKTVLEKIDSNDTYFAGSTKKTLKNVKNTLEKGGPWEHGVKKTPSGNQMIDTLDSITEYKGRVLNARRDIDDLLKNKDIEKLGRHDVDVLLKTREKMNKFLQQDMAGADAMSEADALWHNFANAKEDILKPVKSVEKNSVSSDKLERMMKRNTFKRDEWLESTKGHFDFLKGVVQDNPELSATIEATGMRLEQLSTDLQNKQFLDNLTLIGGGPTGKAVKGLLHAAGFAGGFFHPMAWVAEGVALPLVDPDRWFRIKDTMLKAAHEAGNAKAVQSFIGEVEKGASALGKSGPRVVTSVYLVNKKEPKQEE
jgi:hypothetical protein